MSIAPTLLALTFAYAAPAELLFLDRIQRGGLERLLLLRDGVVLIDQQVVLRHKLGQILRDLCALFVETLALLGQGCKGKYNEQQQHNAAGTLSPLAHARH